MAKGASKAAQSAYGQDVNAFNQYNRRGSDLQDVIQPFLQQELNNPQGYGLQTTEQMQTEGGQAVAGATGAAGESAQLAASRTGNPAATAGVIDATARNAMRQQSNNALDIARQNALLKEQQKQAGATGLEHLYGEDVNAALKALGLEDASISAWTSADQASANKLQNYIQDYLTEEQHQIEGAQIAAQAAGGAGCWIAAKVFGEDFFGEKTSKVRDWLWNEWIKNWYGKPVLWLYSKLGEQLSECSFVVKALAPLFHVALRKAEAWETAQ